MKYLPEASYPHAFDVPQALNIALRNAPEQARSTRNVHALHKETSTWSSTYLVLVDAPFKLLAAR